MHMKMAGEEWLPLLGGAHAAPTQGDGGSVVVYHTFTVVKLQ